MQEIVYHTNYELEDTYWWFVARNKLVRNLIDAKCKIPEGSDFLDAGCGTGGFTKMLTDKFRVLGLDSSEIALDYCRKRGLNDLFKGYLNEFPKNDYNVQAITMLDVIEHIEDDKSVIGDAYGILPEGGYFIATVPAYQWLWSHHDIVHMHYRRYTKNRISKFIRSAGFDIRYSSYFNTFLMPPAVAARIIEKIAGSQKAEQQPVDKVPGFIDKLFRNIFLAEKPFLTSTGLPFGLSIIVIAQK